MALYTALGFVVLVFFLVTALSARVQFNLRLVENAADRTRLFYLAQGGVNEVIARVNRTTDALEPPTKTRPFTRTEDGITVEVWFEEDPQHPDVRHVRGRARSSRGEQEFEKVVSRKPVLNPVFFTTGVPGLGSPASVLRNTAGSPDWELLPPVPNFTAGPDGNIVRQPGFSITVHGVTADQEGNAYSVTSPPITDPTYGPLFQQMLQQGMQGTGRLTEAYLMYGGMVDQVGPLATQVLRGARPVLTRYSGRDNNWSAVPPPPDVRLTSSGEFENTGEDGPGFLLQPTVGASQNELFIATIRPGQDSIQKMEGTAGHWSTLPAAPMGTGPGFCKALMGLSCSPEGTLYSQWAPDRSQPHMAGVYRYDSDHRKWSALPPPPRQYGEARIPPWQLLGQMQAGPRGTLYMTFWNPPPPAPPAPDSVISYSPVTGEWSLVTPPQPKYYNQTGTLEEGPQLSTIDSLGIDVDGGLLVKYPKQGSPHTVYRRNGNYEALPPLPRIGHDHTGQIVREPGYMPVQANVAGGGVPTGATRYAPTASF